MKEYPPVLSVVHTDDQLMEMLVYDHSHPDTLLLDIEKGNPLY